MNRIHVLIIAVLVGLIALLWSAIVRAHEPYTSWKIPGTNASCCDNRDCRPTRARQDDSGQWEAWDGERWLKVPPDRALKIKSPDGRSHLCAVNGGVLCFVPGETMF